MENIDILLEMKKEQGLLCKKLDKKSYFKGIFFQEN